MQFGGHTTGWRYGRGVPIYTQQNTCSIQVIRRPMGSHYRLAIRTWGPCACNKNRLRFRSVDEPSGHTTSVRFRSVDDPWRHTTDWRYSRGVPVRGTKHERSIQVVRRPMHATPLTSVTDVGSPYTYQNTCSIQASPRSMGAHHRLALRFWGPRA